MAINPKSLENLKPMKKGERTRNPNGRPKLKYVTAMRNALNNKVTQDIANEVVDLWLAGIRKNDKFSPDYLKLLIERCVIVIKEDPIQISSKGKSTSEMIDSIQDVLETEGLTPSQCSSLSQLINSIANTNDIKEVKIMQQKIKEALENS